VTVFHLAAALVLAVVLGAPAHAQTVHRKDVPAGEATPTGGSFSIHLPVAFTDVEMRADDPPAPPAPPAIVRMLTGLNSDGVRFSATEMPMMVGVKPKPMEEFMEATKKRPGAAISDVHRDSTPGGEILSFALTDGSGGYFFRLLRTNDAQYMQVIQFPETERRQAAAVRDDFFASFKIIKP
jgi:hypothetical protein